MTDSQLVYDLVAQCKTDFGDKLSDYDYDHLVNLVDHLTYLISFPDSREPSGNFSLI